MTALPCMICYSYNEKHNEANGWNNTDGADDNRSWNCGAEGETQEPEVLSLRFRLIRNACAVLLCSRGTPMFLAGDEFGNTQYGNNNAYCQDNEISWLDWRLLEKNRELFAFFRFMIRYRLNHPAIREELPGAVCGLESVRVYGRGCGEGGSGRLRMREPSGSVSPDMTAKRGGRPGLPGAQRLLGGCADHPSRSEAGGSLVCDRQYLRQRRKTILLRG